MAAVSVIVPACNAAATLGATLEALDAQDFERPYEVIVVDDGSQDETAAIARAAGGNVAVLTQARRGPGPARNRGAQAAIGDVLAFTDADCFPRPDWLRRGFAALERVDLVQGAVRPDPRVPPAPFDRSVTVAREAGLYETANMFVSRAWFDRLGGFEDWLSVRIGKPLAEDVWFGWRARRAGARIVFTDEALVDHAVFRRGPGAYVGERLRAGYFAEMVVQMPELRDEFLYRRWFLTRRTAAFDAAVVSLATALATRSPLPLLAALPYASVLRKAVRPWGRRAPAIAAVEVVADVVGLGSLLAGSARRRTMVL